MILPLRERGIIQSGRGLFSRERELSGSFLPPQLEKLHSAALEAFWNVGGCVGVTDTFDRFIRAVNLIEADKQLPDYPMDISAMPVGTLDDETVYLAGLSNICSNIIQGKILYEYQRKNGSLTYWLYDKKPLLTMAELMRRLPDEERGVFVNYCLKLNDAEKVKHRKMFEAANVSKS